MATSKYAQSIKCFNVLKSHTTALQKNKRITASEAAKIQALITKGLKLQTQPKPDPKAAAAVAGQINTMYDKIKAQNRISGRDYKILDDNAVTAVNSLKKNYPKPKAAGTSASTTKSSSKARTYATDPKIKGDLLPHLKTGGAVSESYINKIMDFDVYRMKNANTEFHQKGRAYIFISTPNLNLGALDVDPKTKKPSGTSGTTNRTSDSFFYEMSISEPHLMNSLTTDGTFDPFIKICTNAFHAVNLTDTVLRTRLHGETLDGFKQILPTSYTSSTVANQLTIEYTEFSGTPVLKLHKLWVDYMHNVRRGSMRPSPETIQKKLIDYLSSLYYFQVGPDGETITYFAKYTGIAPIALPHSAFSHAHNDFSDVSVQIPYVFQFKEEINPDIISDFNIVSAAAAKDASIKDMGRGVADLAKGPQGTPKYIDAGSDIPRGITYPVAQQVRVDKYYNKDVGPGKPSYKYKLVFI